MTEGRALTVAEIRAALSELNELSRAEYGIDLEELLLDRAPATPIRMQRLTGIVLKQKFAKPRPAPRDSTTGARRAWLWRDGPLEADAAGAERELELLNELRLPGAWNERKPLSGTRDDKIPIDWHEFRDDVEHERGLFKVVALYVADRLKAREGRTLREYLAAQESRRFEAGLDLAVVLSQAAVLEPIAGLLGLPTLSVGLTLVGIQFGYRRLTDPDEGRIPDREN